ncbi:MAG: hypothetical protein CMH83_06710 [Nocardioides sp.]|nr:hypothetical protein [Nocardioides sp.]
MAQGARAGLLVRVVLPTVLALLLVGVVTTSVVLWRDRGTQETVTLLRPADLGNPQSPGDGRARGAVASARRAATTYFTLDHRHVDRDMAAFKRLTTDEFGEAYDRDAAALAERIEKQQLVLTASLPDDGSATEYLTTADAQVLVVVQVTTARPTGSTTTRFRTRVTLEREPSSADDFETPWRVSDLEEVP